MEEAFKSVEWSTIFFFIGLFILVVGLVETGVIASGYMHLKYLI